jgi:hypothetical protein
MKPFFALVVLCICAFNSLFAQIFKPTHWKFESKRINSTEFYLIATVKLDTGWYIYSQFIKGDGPNPTTFTFKQSAQYELVGNTVESSDYTIFKLDEIFNMNTVRFSNEVKFTQHIKLKKTVAQILGTVLFFTRTDKLAIPPDEKDFQYRLKTSSDVSKD